MSSVIGFWAMYETLTTKNCAACVLLLKNAGLPYLVISVCRVLL